MFRFTTRELVLMGITSLITAAGMYAAWQADRAVMALELSHAQHRANFAEMQMEQMRKGERQAVLKPATLIRP